MPLKFKLDSLDGLSEDDQKKYVKKGDKFVLDVEGLDDGDVVGLKKKVEDLLAETAKLKDKVRENDDAARKSAEEARRAAEDAAAKKGDIEALRKSADERVAQAIAETEAKYKPGVEKANNTIRKLLVDNVATSLAAKIGLKGSERLLVPHITNRLAVEEREGEHVTVIRDAQGKASTLSVADLEKEFVGNPEFAPVIAGSQASGGGAGGGNKPGGAAPGAKEIKRSDFSALDPAKQMEVMKAGTTVID
jgi:hypothetical protein